jgi:group II intron reverse transcriptase/maturase
MKASFGELAKSGALCDAFRQVNLKKGSPGVDGVTVQQFGANLDGNVSALVAELEAGTYCPLPALMRHFREGEKVRPIAIPAVRDRVIQRAVADLLAPVFEPTLSDASYAFRRGRSPHDAVRIVAGWAKTGFPWLLLADIESFFDRIDQGILMVKLMKLIDDERVLSLIHRLLRTRVFDHMVLSDWLGGVPQGSPLSPLFSNIYLDEFDRALLDEGFPLVRYCDDFVVACRNGEEVRTARTLCENVLQGLRLTLHPTKTHSAGPGTPFVFLGFSFTGKGIGPSVEAVGSLGRNLLAIAQDPALCPEALHAGLRGWVDYFGEPPLSIAETPEGLLALLGIGVDVPLKEGKPAVSFAPRADWVHLSLAREMAFRGFPVPALAQCLMVAPERFRADPGLPALVQAFGLPDEEVELLADCHELSRNGGHGKEDAVKRLHERGYASLADAFLSVAAPEIGLHRMAPDSQGMMRPEVLHRFLALFSGHPDRHAMEIFDGRGHRRFIPVPEPITVEHLREHLAGRRTLGVYLFRPNGTVRLLVLDIDVKREHLKAQETGAAREIDLAHRYAVRLCRVARSLDLQPLLEDSGCKGRHVWIFFQEALPADWARSLACRLLRDAGEPPAEIRCEIFPDRDRLKPGLEGPVIKLPLGIHGRTGRWCRLLYDDGRSVRDPSAILFRQRTIPRPRIAEGTTRSTSLREPASIPASVAAPTAAMAADPAWADADADPLVGLTATIRTLQGCSVLRYLYRKARATRYLTHYERLALLYGIGHLGEESQAAIHKIMAYTMNYKTAVTQRWFDSRKESPISCERLRERFRELSSRLACDCSFKLSKGLYPSPVLHSGIAPSSLRPSWDPSRRKPHSAPGSSAPEESEPRPAAPAPPTDLRSDRSRAEGLVARIADLRKQQRGVEAALDQAAAELDGIFDRLSVDRLEIAGGVLVRLNENGKSRYRIEL